MGKSRATKPLRVLYFYAGSHLDSGSPKALLGLIDLLDRTRIAPLFLAIDDGPLIDELRHRGVEIIRGPKPDAVSHDHPLRAFAAIARFARFLRRHHVDVLHVNEFGWNLDIVLAAPLARVSVILHVHLPGTVLRNNLNGLIAKRVLLVSEAHKQAIGNFEQIAAKTDVMYNAVDLERFANGHSIRESLGLAPDDIAVGSLAQLREGKGLDVLLQAARQLIPRYPRLVFLVAGRLGHGEEEYGKALMQEASSPEFQGRFRFLGSRQDVPDLLASFDVFVLPTRAETFGLAVVEAMAAGVPVVATGIPAIAEVVGSSGRLFDEVEVGPLSTAIEEVITSPDRGRSMGERGRASLYGRFDRASLAAKLQRIYDEVGG